MRTIFVSIGIVAASVAYGASVPESVKEVVRGRVDDGKAASMVIALVDADGVEYFAYGKASRETGAAPDENSIYEIGSISKVFTAILLADMKNRGEVAFDDPIEKYLPESVKAPTRNGASITLAHLSEQTSGLPRMPNNFKPKDPGNPFADYTPELLYAFLSGYELKRDIGEKFEYSNVGVGLLGHVLELASGKTYETLVIEHIATPLGMPDTRISLSDDMKSRLAIGYVGERPVKNWDIATLAGAGAIRSSAKDMVTFLQANIGLVESTLHDAMKESHAARVDTDSPESRIGLGWITLDAEGGPSVTWHNGGTGGYRTWAGFSEETRTGAVVLCNSGGEGQDDIGFHLLNPSLPMTNTVKRSEVEVSRDILLTYAGKYQMPGATLTIDMGESQLTVQLTGQPRFPIFAESETEFFLKAVDAQISFEKDDTGKVVAAVLHQGGRDMRASRIE